VRGRVLPRLPFGLGVGLGLLVSGEMRRRCLVGSGQRLDCLLTDSPGSRAPVSLAQTFPQSVLIGQAHISAGVQM
jgi:hypothetical protein